MLDNWILQKMEAIVGKNNLLTEKVDLVTYSYDATADVPRTLPDAVVMPVSTEQVQHIVRIASAERIPLYPRGAGTNLSGGCNPLKKGIVLSLQRMNKILEIDTENLTATVQPGVVIQDLNNAVAANGLIYPPDPGTVATATMGGSVAENSGGLRGLKYGVTKHYVMGMEVVLADGDKFRFGGKTVKNVTAYEFQSLFIGSEGTLGIITEIIAKLIPEPKYKKSMMGLFRTLEDAGNTVAGIIKARVIPATLEIMDKKTIESVENYAKIGLPLDVAALLLIEVDSMSQEVVNIETQAVIKVIEENKGELKVANSDAERDKLWAARRAALPALAQLNNTVIIEDATVPRSKITDMLVACEEIGRRNNVTLGTFGHAGDGNLHPTILFDSNDQVETARVHKAVDEIFATALSLGGTLSGEHGIGIAKMKYLGTELGSGGLAVMKKLKAALDPNNILNPAKMVPCERM